MHIYEEIQALAASREPELVAIRRDLHAHPETGWLEFRTSAIIAGLLKDFGFDEVLTGKAVCKEDARMGVPSEEVLEKQYQEVREELEREDSLPVLTKEQKRYAREALESMRGGFTGVVGILRGTKPIGASGKSVEDSTVSTGDGAVSAGDSAVSAEAKAPVVAIRCDIDALPVNECREESHFPTAWGFASEKPGIMHACGHDGHTTIGLGTAMVLAGMKDRFAGTVKFLFQPAEEGVRGAYAMVEAGHLDDVDILLGSHMSGTPESEPSICVNTNYTLATTKMDVTIHGRAAHAGAHPEEGRNALLAACAAVQNLYAIPRRAKSVTRINVGTLQAGTGRNVIADKAFFEMEVRGDSSEANAYMKDSALRIIDAAASMQGCTWEYEVRGAAGTCTNTPELMDQFLDICEKKLGMKAVRLPDHSAGASEDFAWMGERVKQHGGQVCYFRNVSHLPASIHHSNFDFEECALVNGVKAFAGITADLLEMRE